MFRLITALTLLIGLPVHAEDWPQFRGPKGDGHYTGKALPGEWGTDKNVTWKTPIDGTGWSSPIVWKGKVYLTAARGEKGPMADQSLRAICVDAKSGKIDWDVEVYQQIGAKSPKPHSKNSHASPTPVTDGDRIYVHFGHQGTAALDLTGTIVWKKKYTYSPVHGGGCSPILVDDLVVFGCDGGDQQFLVGLNKKTGEEVWKTPRNAGAQRGFSFETPSILETGKEKVIVSGASNIIAGYDPKTGKEIWRVKYNGYSLIPKPIFGHGLIYFTTGYDSPILNAVKPEGSGDITDKIVWTVKKNVPNTPSLLLVGDELYMISDGGTMSCLDAKKGDVIWSERLPTGGFSSSPIYHDGKIYATNEVGVGVVVKASRTFELLSKNDLKEKTFASFAAVDGALFIRTETQLYRFDAK